MKPKGKIPVGLKLLQVLLIIVFILELIGVVITLTALGGEGRAMFFNPVFFAYEIFSLVSYIVFLVAINRPSGKLYKAFVALLTIDIIAGIAFIAASFGTPFSHVFSIVIDALVLWFIMKIETYFATGSIDTENPSVKKLNNRFITALVVLIVLAFLIPVIWAAYSGVTAGVNRNREVAQFNAAFKGATTKAALDYCQTLSESEANDCIIYLVALTRTAAHLGTSTPLLKDTVQLDVGTCSLMKGIGGVTACYAVFDRCDLATEENYRRACETTAAKHKIRIDSLK